MKPKKGYTYREIEFSEAMTREIDRTCAAQGCSFFTFVWRAVEKALNKRKQ